MPNNASKLLFIFIGLILTVIKSEAQKTEVLVLSKSSVKHRKLANGVFQLIPSRIDASSLQYIATIKATAKKTPYHNLSFLEAKIKEKGQKLGANSYKLSNYQLNDRLNTTALTPDVYWSADSILNSPSITKDTNEIFIFPPVLYWKKFEIRFNNETIELDDREYFVYL